MESPRERCEEPDCMCSENCVVWTSVWAQTQINVVSSPLPSFLFLKDLFLSIVYLFNTKKHSLFFEKNGNTIFFIVIFLFVLCCSNLLFGFSFSVISKNRTILHTPLFQKKKKCMIPSCSPVFLWTLFYSAFFSFIYFLNSFVKTCYSFLFISCFFLCLFVFSVFSLVCSLFFFVVYMLFVNIVFSESSSFNCVFSQFFRLLVLISLFWEIVIVVSVLLSLFFWSSFSFIIFLFPPTKLFSLFHSVRLFLFFEQQTTFLFSIVVSSILSTFQIPFSVFCLFSFSFFFLRVFFILFVCLSYVFLLSLFLFFLCHFSLSLFASCSFLSLFSFSFFLFFSTSLILFRHLFFLYGRFLSISFFLDLCFSVSLLCFSYLLVVKFSVFLYILFLSLFLFCLFSFFCFFTSFCPSPSHFASLPSLTLSILLAFLDLHHLFFFFIAFFLNSFLDVLEIPCVSWFVISFCNSLLVKKHLTSKFSLWEYFFGTSLLSFFFHYFSYVPFFLFVFLSSLLFSTFSRFFLSAYFNCRSLCFFSLFVVPSGKSCFLRFSPYFSSFFLVLMFFTSLCFFYAMTWCSWGWLRKMNVKAYKNEARKERTKPKHVCHRMRNVIRSLREDVQVFA